MKQLSTRQGAMSAEDVYVALLRGSHSSFNGLNWKLTIQEMSEGAPSDDLAERFLTQWVTHGANIRNQVGDDVRLACFLRNWLPRYTGPSMQLFRGESLDRFRSGRIGFCWTPNREVAEMFARGVNASRPSGSVLLQAEV